MAKKKHEQQPSKPLRRTSPAKTRVASADESKEMLSEWWQDNGKYFIAGALIGIAVIGGWRGWDYYTETQAKQAAIEYRDMLSYLAIEDNEEAEQIFNAIREQYTATVYPVFASFTMAKFKVEQGQLEEAADDLRWITEHSPYDELKSLAWVRLARILLELDKKEEAYEIVLSYSFPRGVEELAAEIRGDYLVKEGEYGQAQSAYQSALSTSMVDDYNFIMMKVEQIGGQLGPPES